MGQVYKVCNTLSERVEAMKVLLPKLEGEQGLADRFLREIKTQATFDHPNIAKLYTAMRVGDQLLMFMEFVDGVSLAKELEKGPLAAGEAAAYTAQVLDALAYAHGRGVVHRDIKPANIMITDAGVAKLMDFGIARAEADSRLTQTGNAVGSLAYMSPEQINGSNPDPRSDIYSLGITLYEMVTGKRPFGGDSGYSIMSAHLKQTPVAPIELTPGLPPDLSDIILMAIAKDPAGRFQSAMAFRGALVSVFPGIAAPLHSQDSTQTMPLGVPIAAQAPAAAAPTAATKVAAPPPPMAPPVPIMAAAPLPPSTVTSSGRRGIYMALGSVVTLAVLVAAVIEGPKLLHGGLSDAFGKGTSAPAASTAPPSVPATPASDAAGTPAATPDTATPAAASDAGTSGLAASAASASAAAASAITATASAPVAAVSPAGTPKTPSNPAVPASVQPVGKTRGAQPASADRRGLPETPAPAAAPPAAPAQSAQNFAPAPVPQAAPAAPPSPVVNPAVNPEAQELRQRFNDVSIRATTARNGLHSFEQQQARQGLGLRADIREAQARMDYQLQEATAYLQRGDIDNARTSLRYAQSAVETIEKFLGR
jgi:serine/threonine-protein kinase